MVPRSLIRYILLAVAALLLILSVLLREYVVYIPLLKFICSACAGL